MKREFMDFEAQYKYESANDYYCMHCAQLKTSNFTCCNEMDFIKFKEFDDATQANIIEEEYKIAFGVAT